MIYHRRPSGVFVSVGRSLIRAAAAWQRLIVTCPQLASVEPDVEALLVNTVHGLDHHWIVSIDDCYRMVAVVRREWRGLSGGGRVWQAVERFFEDLTERP